MTQQLESGREQSVSVVQNSVPNDEIGETPKIRPKLSPKFTHWANILHRILIAELGSKDCCSDWQVIAPHRL
jgi:hypothetical protein